MPAKPTVAEAKRNFAAAMDKLSVADAVREHPLESVGAAFAAGALVGLSGRRISRIIFPILEMTGWASRWLSK